MEDMTFDKKIGLCKEYFFTLDKQTQEHSLRVGQLCEEIGKDFGYDENLLYTIGVLHDIGKIWIPYEFLNKKTELTKDEKDKIDLHGVYGGKIIKTFFPKNPQVFLPVTFHHGFGINKSYVSEETNDALKKLWKMVIGDKNFRFLTLLVRLADIYDACFNMRIYREYTLSCKEIEIEMKKNSFLYDEEIKTLILENDIVNYNYELDLNKIIKNLSINEVNVNGKY